MLTIYKADIPGSKGKDKRIMLSSHELYSHIDKCHVQYARWLKHNIISVGVPEVDYVKNAEYKETRKGPKSKDLLLTVDFAKGLCQVARNPAGNKLRAWLLTL